MQFLGLCLPRQGYCVWIHYRVYSSLRGFGPYLGSMSIFIWGFSKGSSFGLCWNLRSIMESYMTSWRIFFSFFLCSQWVPNMFSKFPMCSLRVFPITPRFNPRCFAPKVLPLLTYIRWAKGAGIPSFHRIFYFGQPPKVQHFFCDGPVKLAHCKNKKKKEKKKEKKLDLWGTPN
jgi:hypothetical protein